MAKSVQGMAGSSYGKDESIYGKDKSSHSKARSGSQKANQCSGVVQLSRGFPVSALNSHGIFMPSAHLMAEAVN
jgi:hypothetical protein